jgi:hypothetical protein
MRQGFLPGQQRELRRAFRKADAFDRLRQRTRRQFLAMLGLSMAAGVGGVFAGRASRLTTSTEPPRSKELSALHELALGPIANLERRAMHLIDGLRQHPADEKLGYGAQRLVTVAMVHADNQVLRVRLLNLLPEAASFPLPVRQTLEQLAEFVRR